MLARRVRGLALIVMLCPCAVFAQSGMTQQDSTLNNLEHPQGYLAASLGNLGEVVRRGTGPVDVVIIPGWGFSARDFEGFMTANERRYRMVAVTLPGFGGRPAPPMPPAGTSYAEGTWTRAAERAIADLIRAEGLRRPVILGHFIVGSQMAFRLATAYPDLVGGVVSIGAEPMRWLPSPRDSSRRTPATLEERARMIDQFAVRWYRTVTEQTWDFNNYRAPQYARDSTVAAQLWSESAAVPIPTMVRYLCEYMAQDLTEDFRTLQLPAKVLVPSFSPEIFADPLQSYVKTLFVDAWARVRQAHPNLAIEAVSESRIFVHLDQPQVVQAAIDGVAKARRATGRS